LLVDEHEVLDARGAVSIGVDHLHVADELAPGRRRQQGRRALDRVRGSEGAVLRIRGEDLEPLGHDELARVGHVAGAQLVDLDEVGDPLRVPAHGTGSILSSKEEGPVCIGSP
jgi:hypothetical protein